jgi:hypothetical protein
MIKDGRVDFCAGCSMKGDCVEPLALVDDGGADPSTPTTQIKYEPEDGLMICFVDSDGMETYAGRVALDVCDDIVDGAYAYLDGVDLDYLDLRIEAVRLGLVRRVGICATYSGEENGSYCPAFSDESVTQLYMTVKEDSQEF